VLTSVTIALFPHHVPLQFPPPPSGGGCETCDPNQVVIPPGLRHEYWVELSVGQSGMLPLLALEIAPFFGAWLGVLGGGLARTSPGTRRPPVSGPRPLSPLQPPGRLMASDADRENVADVLKAAFAGGRLSWEELDLRVGQALTARTSADLAALTADLPAGRSRTEPAGTPAPAPPRPQPDRVVAWSASGLIAVALLTATVAVPSPTPTDDSHVGLILFLATVVFFLAWLAAGAHLLDDWHRQRSRPGAGRDRTEPGSPAVRD
jgi:hypothetical protein